MDGKLRHQKRRTRSPKLPWLAIRSLLEWSKRILNMDQHKEEDP